jgi:hypothetical protein
MHSLVVSQFGFLCVISVNSPVSVVSLLDKIHHRDRRAHRGRTEGFNLRHYPLVEPVDTMARIG